MNISAPFIQRPIATALLMVGLLVGGLIAYPLLPVASLPSVNYPTLTVTAQLPGTDPQTMASTVASPLELQFGEIPGLTQMTSSSALDDVIWVRPGISPNCNSSGEATVEAMVCGSVPGSCAVTVSVG